MSSLCRLPSFPFSADFWSFPNFWRCAGACLCTHYPDRRFPTGTGPRPRQSHCATERRMASGTPGAHTDSPAKKHGTAPVWRPPCPEHSDARQGPMPRPPVSRARCRRADAPSCVHTDSISVHDFPATMMVHRPLHRVVRLRAGMHTCAHECIHRLPCASPSNAVHAGSSIAPMPPRLPWP